MRLECRVGFVDCKSHDLHVRGGELAKGPVAPAGKCCGKVAHVASGRVVSDRDVGNEREASIRRDGDKAAQPVVDARTPAIIMDIEERCVQERVDASQANGKWRERGDWFASEVDKLIEPILAQLIALCRLGDDKTELLQGNVQERSRMKANEREPGQRSSEFIEVWGATIRRYADDADGEPALTGAPGVGVMPAVHDLAMLAKSLPSTAKRLVLLRRDVRQPPDRSAKRVAPPFRGRLAAVRFTQWL